ncbi:MAG: hypothetical protein AAFP79_05020 [Pseudomonadota bacterium]
MADYVVLSFRAMEEMLIGYHELWWRSPGSGGSPFAGDGPWHLMQREPGDIAGRYSLTLIENEAGKVLQVLKLDTERPRTALSSAEVSLRDWIEGLVNRIDEDLNRRAILGATLMLWRGEGRVSWATLAQSIGWARTPSALRQRYKRAVWEMVCRANDVPLRHAKALEKGTMTLDEADTAFADTDDKPAIKRFGALNVSIGGE